MNEKNNLYPIKGVIYSKPIRYAPDKKGKNGGNDYEFPSIILEIRREYQGKDYIELPEFELGRGISTDDFNIGDNVEIVFSLVGKSISPTFHKTAPKAIYIKHTDIQSNDTKVVHGATAAEIRKAEKDEIFKAKNPLIDDDDLDNLPF